MAESTKIAWTHSTFNPWLGCTKVSPGCDHCYAEAQDARGRWDGGAKHWGPGVPRYRTSASNWEEPIKWNRRAAKSGKRHLVFCASLADVFDNEVPEEWRDELFGLIAATPNLDWLVLTKRIGNARAYLNDTATPRRVETMKHVVLAGRLSERHAAERTAEIPDWPGYFITSKGRVLSDRTKGGTRGSERHELTPQAGEAGHARIMLQVEGQTKRPLVHRLVLAAFDRQPKGDEQGCHIDGDATNNALWNLRWGDQASNWSDSKRHGTRRRYSKVSPADVEAMRARAATGATAAALAPKFGISDTQVRNILRGDQWKPEATMEWPLPWVWLGASIVNQEEADRDIPKLLATPAAKRFVSYEPALDAVDFRRWLYPRCPCGQKAPCDLHADLPRPALSWLICGGESGPKARPFDIAWARSTVAQCKAAGVSCFVKQVGSNPIWDGMSGPYEHWPIGTRHEDGGRGYFEMRLRHRAGADPSEWPRDLRVQEWPA